MKKTGKMCKLCVCCVGILLLGMVSAAMSREIGGVDLPDSVTVAGKTLLLNGAGLRTKFFFKIYAGGLYLGNTAKDAEAVINADAPMLVRMHFIYDGVSAEKLQDGWKEGFALTAPSGEKPLQQAIASYVALFKEEARENDVYDVSWQPGHGVDVVRNGTLLGTINGLDFKKALFAIWLGKDPVDDDLKEGMLGK
ncbi:MAG: chalcone isomerase [Desulfobulbus sp.]|nr:MAG: chalcone isomerase [Desulfobulbus sp.]RUM35938.1 MAG: chalcone isomerase [Desulfobulbus sp.]RUM41582.1 MAG: chalcone isomerase [Desulfobulbus sp.]